MRRALREGIVRARVPGRREAGGANGAVVRRGGGRPASAACQAPGSGRGHCQAPDTPLLCWSPALPGRLGFLPGVSLTRASLTKHQRSHSREKGTLLPRNNASKSFLWKLEGGFLGSVHSVERVLGLFPRQAARPKERARIQPK